MTPPGLEGVLLLEVSSDLLERDPSSTKAKIIRKAVGRWPSRQLLD
jgi:hypothetical protein